MSLLGRVGDRTRTVVEFLAAVWRGPNWWLVPVMIFLLPLAVIFMLLQAMPLVAPFVYVVF
jgi:hypothetical protein